MKLRLSHRYLMPDTAVTMATSQHSRMDTSTTTQENNRIIIGDIQHFFEQGDSLIINSLKIS